MIHFEYTTADIVLAAALKYQGVPLVRIHVEGKRGFFVFRDVKQDFLNAFNTGNTLVEPCAFHAEVKALSMAVSRIRGN